MSLECFLFSEIVTSLGDLRKILVDARGVCKSMELILGASKGYASNAKTHAEASSAASRGS